MQYFLPNLEHLQCIFYKFIYFTMLFLCNLPLSKRKYFLCTNFLQSLRIFMPQLIDYIWVTSYLISGKRKGVWSSFIPYACNGDILFYSSSLYAKNRECLAPFTYFISILFVSGCCSAFLGSVTFKTPFVYSASIALSSIFEISKLLQYEP